MPSSAPQMIPSHDPGTPGCAKEADIGNADLTFHQTRRLYKKLAQITSTRPIFLSRTHARTRNISVVPTDTLSLSKSVRRPRTPDVHYCSSELGVNWQTVVADMRCLWCPSKFFRFRHPQDLIHHLSTCHAMFTYSLTSPSPTLSTASSSHITINIKLLHSPDSSIKQRDDALLCKFTFETTLVDNRTSVKREALNHTDSRPSKRKRSDGLVSVQVQPSPIVHSTRNTGNPPTSISSTAAAVRTVGGLAKILTLYRRLPEKQNRRNIPPFAATPASQLPPGTSTPGVRARTVDIDPFSADTFAMGIDEDSSRAAVHVAGGKLSVNLEVGERVSIEERGKSHGENSDGNCRATGASIIASGRVGGGVIDGFVDGGKCRALLGAKGGVSNPNGTGSAAKVNHKDRGGRRSSVGRPPSAKRKGIPRERVAFTTMQQAVKQGRLFHSVSQNAMRADALGLMSDSDTEEATEKEWKYQIQKDEIIEYVDTLPVEKLFMNLWNQFVTFEMSIDADRLMAKACLDFVKKYRSVISKCKLEVVLLRHLSEMARIGLIDSDNVFLCVSQLRKQELNGKTEENPRFLFAEEVLRQYDNSKA